MYFVKWLRTRRDRARVRRASTMYPPILRTPARGKRKRFQSRPEPLPDPVAGATHRVVVAGAAVGQNGRLVESDLESGWAASRLTITWLKAFDTGCSCSNCVSILRGS